MSNRSSSSTVKLAAAFGVGTLAGVILAAKLAGGSQRRTTPDEQAEEQQAFSLSPQEQRNPPSSMSAPTQEQDQQRPSAASESSAPKVEEGKEEVKKAVNKKKKEEEEVLNEDPETISYWNELKQKVPAKESGKISKYLQYCVVDGKRHLIVPLLDLLRRQLDPVALSKEVMERDRNAGHIVLVVACVLLPNPLPVVKKLVEIAKAGEFPSEKEKAFAIKEWVNTRDKENRRTVMHVAVLGQQALVIPKEARGEPLVGSAASAVAVGTVKYLVEECGAVYDIKDKDGASPLHAACGNGDANGEAAAAVISYLVKNGQCSVEIRNHAGFSPLHYAALINPWPIVCKTLIEELGANPRDRDGNNWTTIHAACLKQQNPEVLEYLWEQYRKAEAGASVNDLEDNVGQTPLSMAVALGRAPAIVRSLIRTCGADANRRRVSKENAPLAPNGSKTMRGQTPLHEACARQPTSEVIKILVEEGGADPNILDDDGWTVFHHAAMHNGNIEVLKYLFETFGELKVDNGEKLKDLKAKDGSTPLHCACLVNPNPFAVVKFLVNQQGYSVHDKCNDGKTPLVWHEASPTPEESIKTFLKSKMK